MKIERRTSLQVMMAMLTMGWAGNASAEPDRPATATPPRFPHPSGPTPELPVPEGEEGPEVALVRKHYEMFNAGDFDNWVNVLAPDYRSYSPFGGPNSRQEYFDGTRMYKTAFPDVKIRVVRGIGKNGWAAAHIKYSATFAKDFRGIPATGKVWHRESMGFWRIENGLIVEAWFVEQGGDFYETLRA